jgi:hypothetical protein
LNFFFLFETIIHLTTYIQHFILSFVHLSFCFSSVVVVVVNIYFKSEDCQEWFNLMTMEFLLLSSFAFLDTHSTKRIISHTPIAFHIQPTLYKCDGLTWNKSFFLLVERCFSRSLLETRLISENVSSVFVHSIINLCFFVRLHTEASIAASSCWCEKKIYKKNIFNLLIFVDDVDNKVVKWENWGKKNEETRQMANGK